MSAPSLRERNAPLTRIPSSILLPARFVRSVQQIVAQKKSLKDEKEQKLNEVAVTGLKTFSCAVPRLVCTEPLRP